MASSGYVDRNEVGRGWNFLTQMIRQHQAGKDLSDYHRKWLLKLAWKHRDKLPANLAVIVAVKGMGQK